MTTKTANTIVFSSTIKADIAPYVDAAKNALSAETKAVFGANQARLNLCKALGSIKQRIEDAVTQGELKKGAWKVWCERNRSTIKVVYTTANRYANVGMAEDPSKAFEDFKQRDLAAQHKLAMKKEQEAKAALKAAAESGTGEEPKTGSAGNSDAGNEQRQTEEAPTPDVLAESIRNSVTSLAKFPVQDAKGEAKVLGMAREAVTESATALGMNMVPDGAFVLTSDTPADLVANWMMANWKGCQRSALVKAMRTMAKASQDEEAGMRELEEAQLAEAATRQEQARSAADIALAIKTAREGVAA